MSTRTAQFDLRGKVVAISELPATRQAMEAALEHPELVDAFLKRYAPGVVLRVQIKLQEVPAPGKGGRVPGTAPWLTSAAGRARWYG